MRGKVLSDVNQMFKCWDIGSAVYERYKPLSRLPWAFGVRVATIVLFVPKVKSCCASYAGWIRCSSVETLVQRYMKATSQCHTWVVVQTGACLIFQLAHRPPLAPAGFWCESCDHCPVCAQDKIMLRFICRVNAPGGIVASICFNNFPFAYGRTWNSPFLLWFRDLGTGPWLPTPIVFIFGDLRIPQTINKESWHISRTFYVYKSEYV